MGKDSLEDYLYSQAEVELREEHSLLKPLLGLSQLPQDKAGGQGSWGLYPLLTWESLAGMGTLAPGE